MLVIIGSVVVGGIILVIVVIVIVVVFWRFKKLGININIFIVNVIYLENYYL